MFSSTIGQAARTATLGIRNVVDVSFKYETSSNGFFSRLFGVRNDLLSVQVNRNCSSINVNKVNKEIDRAIRNAHVHKPAWLCQETQQLLSAEINKIIDQVCLQQGRSLTSVQKNRVFGNISDKLGCGVKLDPRCTQSSISQMLNNSSYVSRKLDDLVSHSDLNRREKNEVKNIVTSQLTSVIFEHKFGGVSLDVLRADAMREVCNQLRG
ncbi:hypothetical protein [Providencia rustigianii]|uniref:hypothetical protein n=1 Tax=Providencia rustigianii TaxID=158850 RepID=UPI0038B3F17E